LAASVLNDGSGFSPITLAFVDSTKSFVIYQV